MKEMNTVRLNAYAKLNFTLDITGREGEYHTIDSLVCTVNLYDRIVAHKRREGDIRIRMVGMGSENIPPEENNAQRAAEAYAGKFKAAGADITIYKNIPIGAGLGGSSADAAGVLLALNKLYGAAEGEQLKQLADSLGSDTGYLLRGGFARLGGRGERVQPLGAAPLLHVLLLCPREGVSTAECYKICDTFPRNQPHTERALACFRSGNYEWAAKLFSNDLYEAAKSLRPEVGEALSALRQFSPWGAGMTGSGSGVFAVFETRELCAWAKSRYRGRCRAYVLDTIDPGEGEVFPAPEQE